MCGSVAEWLGSQNCDQQVTSSNPGRHAAECNPGQVVYIHVPLVTKQYNLVAANGQWCSVAGEVTTLHTGKVVPGLSLRHLQADSQGPASAPEPTLVSSMGQLYLTSPSASTLYFSSHWKNPETSSSSVKTISNQFGKSLLWVNKNTVL